MKLVVRRTFKLDPRWVIPLLLAASLVAVLSAYRSIRLEPASPQDIDRILAAFATHSRRHRITTVSKPAGPTVLSEELWTDGAKYLKMTFDPDGVKLSHGFDGKNGYVLSPVARGYIEDHPISPPLEDMPAVMSKSRTSWMLAHRTFRQNNAELAMYTCTYLGTRYECFVDLNTWLPREWVTKNLEGDPMQRRVYDYPAALDPSMFEPPNLASPLVNYPLLRTRLAVQMKAEAPVTCVVQGRRFTVRGVLAARNCDVVAWSTSKDQLGKVWLAYPRQTRQIAADDPLEPAQVSQIRGSPLPEQVDGQPVQVFSMPPPKISQTSGTTLELEAWARIPVKSGVPGLQNDVKLGPATFRVGRVGRLDERFALATNRPRMPLLFVPDKNKPWIVEAH